MANGNNATQAASPSGRYVLLAGVALAASFAVPLLAAYGGLLIPIGPHLWPLTMLFYLAAFAFVGLATKGRLAGVLIGDDNSISLSRFQLVVWTIVLLSALQVAGILNTMFVYPFGDPAMKGPLDITIPPEIWALLGLGSFTTVVAPPIVEGRRLRERAKQTTEPELVLPAPRPSPHDARWSDLITEDYRSPRVQDAELPADISKLQLLSLTLLLVIVYGLAVYRIFLVVPGPTRFPIDAFPVVDAGFIALLGISHAAFLAKQSGFRA